MLITPACQFRRSQTSATLCAPVPMGGGNTVAPGGKEPQLYRALVVEDPGIITGKRPRQFSPSPTLKQCRIFLDLLDAGLSVEEMTPKLQETSPNQPEYFAPWKAECLLQMDAEILQNVVDGKSRGGGDPAESLVNIMCPVLIAQADPDAGGVAPL